MTHISPGELPNTIQISPLVLSDNLLTLAQRADRAGYRTPPAASPAGVDGAERTAGAAQARGEPVLRRLDLDRPVALGEQQRPEVGVIDPGAGFGGHDGLRAERDPEPRFAQHVEIIRAVADRERRGKRQIPAGGQFPERRDLGMAAEDRLGHRGR